jgi:hypothetical protein
MSLRHVDIEAGLRRLAERRIEEAMREGKFDNLSGAGKPVVIDEAPADEEARLLWWALRILRQNDVIPDEVVWRKRVAALKQELTLARDEAELATLCHAINEMARRVNTMGTNRIGLPLTPVDPADELRRFRARRDAGPATS